jgi:hypothetical protein
MEKETLISYGILTLLFSIDVKTVPQKVMCVFQRSVTAKKYVDFAVANS